MNYLNEIQITYHRRPLPIELTNLRVTQSSHSEEIFRALWPEGSMDYRESFYVLFLSRANEVISFCRLSEGAQAGTVTDVKMIFQTALACHAAAIVVAHNHPSGNVYPSKADEILTKKVKQAGLLLDIKLLDHLILTSEEYYSFADYGLL